MDAAVRAANLRQRGPRRSLAGRSSEDLTFDSSPCGLYTDGMCLICIDFERGAMSLKEARRAFGEVRQTLGPAHSREVDEKLAEAERRQKQGADPSDP